MVKKEVYNHLYVKKKRNCLSEAKNNRYSEYKIKYKHKVKSTLNLYAPSNQIIFYKCKTFIFFKVNLFKAY